MFDTFVVYLPACISQQTGDPAIIVSTKLTSEFDHVGHQAPFISPLNWHPPLCGSVLPQIAAGATFLDVEVVRTR